MLWPESKRKQRRRRISSFHPLWTLVRTSELRGLRQEKGEKEKDEEAGGVFALRGPADHLHR